MPRAQMDLMARPVSSSLVPWLVPIVFAKRPSTVPGANLEHIERDWIQQSMLNVFDVPMAASSLNDLTRLLG